VTTADYPYYINTYFTADYRARRITARLQACETKPATVDDMAALHADRVSLPAQAFLQVLAQAQSTDPQVAAARALLLAWDGSMERDSVAATLYGTARTYWLADVLQLTLGRFVTAATGPSGTGRGAPTHATQIYHRAVTAMASGDLWRDCVGAGPEGPSLLPPGQTWPGLIESALGRAVGELRQRLGNDMRTWTWGQVHQTRPRHPLSRLFPELATLLDPPQVAAGGDGDTPQQGAYGGQERFVVTMLSVNRYVFDPAAWRRSRWIVPLGASGHPGSPHFADQAHLWADVEMTPQLWDWDDISAAAETRQQLLPGS
jgi:penicillin amidase